MIAQFLLTALLGGVLLYAWREYRAAPVVALISLVACLLALYFVWEPLHATWLAQRVGIGRGADLVLYSWVVISLIILLNLHLKLRRQMDLITQLTRSIAIAMADRDERPDGDGGRRRSDQLGSR